MKTYTRSIDGFDRKGSSGINCSAIEVSVANIQRGVRGILWSCRRMSDYRWLTRHTHHLTLFLNVTFRLIDPLLPHAVLLLPIILVLSQLLRALPRILLILQIAQRKLMQQPTSRQVLQSIHLSDKITSCWNNLQFYTYFSKQ